MRGPLRRRRLVAAAGALALAPLVLTSAFAWPDQPIHIIVPFTPGVGPDFIGRYVAEHLSPVLSQPVVVENMPGASGNIGSQAVARARPDGLTLLSSVNTLVMNASLFRTLPYDPVTDFAPVGLTAWGSLVLVAHPGQTPDTLAALVALAKAQPRSIGYASPGIGTPHHLAMALLETETGVELLHVPYKGTAGAVQDVLSGQVGFMFMPVHVAATYIRSGKLKALAVSSPQRLPQLPGVPTLSEAGLKGVDVDMWYGFFAPKGTPTDIVDRLNRDINAILSRPDAKAAFEAQGLIPATSTPAAFAEIVARDRTRWAEIVAKRGIQGE